MTNIAMINGTDVPVLHYNGQRVVTLGMVDNVHGRPAGTAGRNFRKNRNRLIKEEDYFEVSSAEIRRINPAAISDAARRNDIILLTETGYLILVKSFTDDLAWAVLRQMVTAYFRLRQAGQEGELAYLKAQQARMRAFTLAFNPHWNKISRLQEAGIGRRQVWGMFGGRTRNHIDVTIEHMEGAGVIQPEDWNEGFVPPSFDAPTPVEIMQYEMALAFGENPNA